MLEDLQSRLLSRKFILSVIGAVVCVVNKQFPELAAIVAAYTAAEGAADYKSR